MEWKIEEMDKDNVSLIVGKEDGKIIIPKKNIGLIGGESEFMFTYQLIEGIKKVLGSKFNPYKTDININKMIEEFKKYE